MTENPHCLTPNHLLAYAINNMFALNCRNIPLVDEDGFPVAILTLQDLLNYIAGYFVEG